MAAAVGMNGAAWAGRVPCGASSTPVCVPSCGGDRSTAPRPLQHRPLRNPRCPALPAGAGSKMRRSASQFFSPNHHPTVVSSQGHAAAGVAAAPRAPPAHSPACWPCRAAELLEMHMAGTARCTVAWLAAQHAHAAALTATQAPRLTGFRGRGTRCNRLCHPSSLMCPPPHFAQKPWP